MEKKTELEYEKRMIRAELKIIILHGIRNFKSKEVPHRKLKSIDIINVLSEIITRKSI